jgi:hypothetical protein
MRGFLFPADDGIAWKNARGLVTNILSGGINLCSGINLCTTKANGSRLKIVAVVGP